MSARIRGGGLFLLLVYRRIIVFLWLRYYLLMIVLFLFWEILAFSQIAVAYMLNLQHALEWCCKVDFWLKEFLLFREFLFELVVYLRMLFLSFNFVVIRDIAVVCWGFYFWSLKSSFSHQEILSFLKGCRSAIRLFIIWKPFLLVELRHQGFMLVQSTEWVLIHLWIILH